jgi:ribosomal subunit interface protein
MQILVKGKQVDVGDALRGYVEDRLENGVAKYFDNAIDATVVFSRDAYQFRTDCTVHVGTGIHAKSHATSDNAHACFDAAADRLEKQLRRYKRRLRNHHTAQSRREHEEMLAQSYVLTSADEDADAPDDADEPQPVVIAETTTDIPVATTSEAVMRLDLTDAAALMFRNVAHGGLNVVYRRADGNIGWIDPKIPEGGAES